MKITILNGNPEASTIDQRPSTAVHGPSSLDAYLASLKSRLEADHHGVNQLDLRDMPLRYCIGCWGCWVKTPGQCSNADTASLEMDRAVINADFVLWAAPLKMGFPSELLKRAMDKHLPLIHPYMVVDHSEAHHRKRYVKTPRLGLLLEQEASTDPRDLQIVSDIFCRTALNFKTRLEFSLTIETPPAELARRISTRRSQPLPLPAHLPASTGVTIDPPRRLTLFNGSPRGRRGNTPIFLREIANGFGRPSDLYHLIRLKETQQMVQAFAEAECVILGFPLYTDAMPGMVKHFFEALEPLVGRPDNPALGFVVQSGFPEGLHSRYVERYLEKLVARLGSPYLGTVVKGNGEGVRIMPPQATHSLFEGLQSLGSGLAREGRFDPEILAGITGLERYPAILGPFFKIMLRLQEGHTYFDGMLKNNGVYERRFARPFAGL